MSRRSRQIRAITPGGEIPVQEIRLETLGLAEELQLALNKVRDEYRTCFILFHQKNLSITHVAELMHCPEGTVKTWLHRARRELAEILVARGVATRDGYEL
jgi:RNA polymerase sigma-70 factor (ECF subfamily)